MDPATIGLAIKSAEGNINSSIKSAQNLFGTKDEIAKQNFDFTGGAVDLGEVARSQDAANSTDFNWRSFGSFTPLGGGQGSPGSELVRMIRARRQQRDAVAEAARMNEGAVNRELFIEDRYKRMNDQMRNVTRNLYG